MFRWVNHNLRVRGAIWLVAVYAFCVVAPPATLAVTNGVLSPHCISKDGSHDLSNHGDVQMEETANSDADLVDVPLGVQHKGKQSKSKICCGMLCISAIASEASPLLPRLHLSSPIVRTLDQYLVGVEGNLQNRPPIAL